MKLSEMNTAQLADALVKIAAPCERIGKDAELNKKLAEHAAKLHTEGMTKLQQNAALIGTVIPALLERHRADTFAILSALTGKSAEVLAAQNGMQTLKEAKACLDDDLMSFFG